MAKKDFSQVQTGAVYDSIATATTAEGERKRYKDRKTYSTEEHKAAANNLHTTGKKGMKLPRINLAFTPDNYEYIKTLAAVRGQNLTEFVNHVLEEHRTEHSDIYEKAIEFRNSL